MRKIALGLILVLLAAAAPARQVSFSAGPPRSGELSYKLEMGPGQSRTERVRITNSSDFSLDFRIYVGQARTGRNGALTGPLFGEEVTGVGHWIEPETGRVSLGPNGRADVRFTVAVPAGTPPGDHLGLVFVEPAPDSPALQPVEEEALAVDKASFAVRVSTRFALPVVVHVPGPQQVSLELESIGKFVRDGRLHLRLTARNDGTVYLKPEASWTLVGPDGQVVVRQDRESWGVLLPGAALVREVPVVTSRPLVRGTYRLQLEADYQDPRPPDEPRQLSRTLELELP